MVASSINLKTLFHKIELLGSFLQNILVVTLECVPVF